MNLFSETMQRSLKHLSECFANLFIYCTNDVGTVCLILPLPNKPFQVSLVNPSAYTKMVSTVSKELKMIVKWADQQVIIMCVTVYFWLKSGVTKMRGLIGCSSSHQNFAPLSMTWSSATLSGYCVLTCKVHNIHINLPKRNLVLLNKTE